MSDFRRKLFEWLEPDWLEEAGRFPVPDHHGDVHDGPSMVVVMMVIMMVIMMMVIMMVVIMILITIMMIDHDD